MRRIKSKIKTLSRNQIKSIKGKGNGNGNANGWNNPWMKGNDDYNRQLDKELGYCPPPEPDNEFSMSLK